jgi:hypothetical protein
MPGRVDLDSSITSSARASGIGGTLSPSLPMTRSRCGVERLPSQIQSNVIADFMLQERRRFLESKGRRHFRAAAAGLQYIGNEKRSIRLPRSFED